MHAESFMGCMTGCWRKGHWCPMARAQPKNCCRTTGNPHNNNPPKRTKPATARRVKVCSSDAYVQPAFGCHIGEHTWKKTPQPEVALFLASPNTFICKGLSRMASAQIAAAS